MKGLFVVLILVAIGAAWYYSPVNHHQAATGTYFLREYISFTTPNGVVGWAPGQEIHEVLKAPFVEGSKTLTDGKLIAVIPDAVLTQDIEDADAMRQADNASQAQAKSDVAALKMHIASRELTAQIASAQDMTRMNAQQVAASTVGAYNTRLNDPTRYVGGSWSPNYYYAYPTTSGSGTTTYTGATRPSSLTQTASRNLNVYEQRALSTPLPTPSPATVGTAR